MSISSLESLPNEILCKLFERYINGVDILNAFVHQQNQRFDNIIGQCRQFSFNFIDCQKEQYDSCVNQFNSQGVFPIDKIVELALSEENATGQVKSFLTLSPHLYVFPNLRKLYVHLNEQTVYSEEIKQTIRDLPLGSIETLSIRISNNVDHAPLLLPLDDQIVVFHHLKRLFLYDEVNLNQWFSRGKEYPQLQYFTYSGSACEWAFLPLVFHCCPQLRYLNIEFAEAAIDFDQTITIPQLPPIVSIPNLQTLVLSFRPTDRTEFDMLSNYLLLMPNLQRLQIKAHSALLNADEWENLLQTPLLCLRHFRLQTTTLHIQERTLDNLLDSFDKQFWRDMEDFYFIITKHKYFNSNGYSSEDVFSQPVTSWWVVPFRRLIDDKPTNHIHSFAVCDTATYLPEYYYFSKIQTLLIEKLDESFLQWLRRFMNFFSIEYVDVSHLKTGGNHLDELLSSLPNLTTLRISQQHLQLYQSPRIKYLYVTNIVPGFETDTPLLISKQYPNLEHLKLHTVPAVLGPEWRTRLPNLRSLTYFSRDEQWMDRSAYLGLLIHTVRGRNRLAAQRLHPWVTIWINEETLASTQS